MTWKLNVEPEAALAEPRMESMERSADAVDVALMPVVAVLELSEVFGSEVIEVIVAVLLICPEETFGDVFAERVKLVSDSTSKAEAVQVMAPPEPTAAWYTKRGSSMRSVRGRSCRPAVCR